MKICVVGTGYVGLVTGTCFAELGNEVTCSDQDTRKINLLKKGVIPIFEPGLSEMVTRNVKAKRLHFTTDVASAVKSATIIFICVGTPSKPNGDADLSAVETISNFIARHLNGYKLIVEKSTVPVETGERVWQTIHSKSRGVHHFDVASNPEFLREGSAIHDFMNPDRVVIGVRTQKAKELLLDLYRPLKAPVLVTDIKSAEIIKHASNSFLATKISFINAVSRLCDKVGADVQKVAEGMGLDRRIGPQFLQAGLGFGGSCFPKDLAAFSYISKKLHIPFEILESVISTNEEQKSFFIEKIERQLGPLKGKRLAVWGLAFKPNTDDMREASSIQIIGELLRKGAEVTAFDPQSMEKAKPFLKKVKFQKTAYEVCRQADALLILTEWSQFREIDLQKVKKIMKKPVIFDGRNIYDLENMKKLGFKYHSIGRPAV
jgi:UDPglucose 6-dehydrogenase